MVTWYDVFAAGMKRPREDPPITETTEEKPQPPLAPAPITESTELEVIDLTEDPFFFSDRVSSFLASTFGPAIGIYLQCRCMMMDDIIECDDDDYNAIYIRDNWFEGPDDRAEFKFSDEKFAKELEDKNNHGRVEKALLYIEGYDTPLREVWENCERNEDNSSIFDAYYVQKMHTFSELLALD